MPVEGKNRISRQKSKQQNRIERRNVVRNINGFGRQGSLVKLNIAPYFKELKNGSEPKLNKFAQDSSPQVKDILTYVIKNRSKSKAKTESCQNFDIIFV